MPRRCKMGDEEFDLLAYDELTLGEKEELERITGFRGIELQQLVYEQAAVMKAGVFYLSIRRSNPDVSLDDVKSRRDDEFLLVESDADAPPAETPEAGGASG